jgi:hypothetical protein
MGRGRALAEFHRKIAAVRAANVAVAAAPPRGKMNARRQIANKHGVPVNTLSRWQRNLRDHGPAALVPHWAKTEGPRTIPRQLQRELLAEWNTPLQPSFEQAWHYAWQWARDRRVACPSYHAVRRYLKRHANKTLNTALRKGKKAHADACRYHVVRDPNELPVNAVFCADHRIADVFCIMPDQRIGRPWETLFTDLASGRQVGWVVREQVSSEGVASALRRAILGFVEPGLDGQPIDFPACGLPEVLLIDRGKEFSGGAMAKAFTRRHCRPPEPIEWDPSTATFELEPAADKTLADTLGIDRVRTIPYHAWSKPIEAVFRSISNGENLVAGYCGRDAKSKPELLKRLVERGQLMTLDQYRAYRAQAAHQWNTTHVVGHLRDRPPMAYYAGHVPKLPPAGQLDTLLLRPGSKVARAHGIEIPGLGRYMSEEPGYIALIGHRVELGYTRDDPSAIVAWHPRTGRRFVLPRIPTGGDWSMMFGGDPSPQFKQAQRIRRVQGDIIREAKQTVARTANPGYLDATGTYRAAARNAHAPKPTADRRLPTAARRALPAPSDDPSDRSDPSDPPSPMEDHFARVGAAHIAELAAIAALDPQEELAPDDHRHRT